MLSANALLLITFIASILATHSDIASTSSLQVTNPVQQSASIQANLSHPVIESITSDVCIPVPHSRTHLVNCTDVPNDDDWRTHLPIAMIARNIVNESFVLQTSDDGISWHDERAWTWNYSDSIADQLNGQVVSISVNLSVYPGNIRVHDHKLKSNATAVLVETNYCARDQQLYFINYPDGPQNIVQCRDCPSGSVIDDSDQTICIPCAPETYWMYDSCIQCPSNTFQPNSSSLACYTCTDRPDMEECKIGDIPLAIAIIAALASPLVTLAIVMCVVRQRAMGRCRCKCLRVKEVVVDFDDADEEFLEHQDEEYLHSQSRGSE